MRPFHLAFPVRDLAEARAFYGGILGCPEGRSSASWIDFDFFGHQVVAHLSRGPAVTAACKELRRTRYPDGLPVGEAVLTTAGNLPARFVVHTVGPIWGSDEPAPKLLASCYRRAIELVDAEGLQSISFPAIATGAYGYPKDRAAQVASRAIADALGKAHAVRKVHLVFFSDVDRIAFEEHQQFP